MSDLTYNSNLVPAVTTETNTVYVAKSGNDVRDGSSFEKSKLTIGSAITAASALSPTVSNIITISIIGGGVFDENITIPSFIHVIGLSAIITSSSGITVTGSQGALIDVYEVRSTGATGVPMEYTDEGFFRFFVNLQRMSLGSGNGFRIGGNSNSCFANFNVGELLVNGGSGIELISGKLGVLYFTIQDLVLQVDGSKGIEGNWNSGSLPTGTIYSLADFELTTDGVGIDLNSGELYANINFIDLPTAWDVSLGATLNGFMTSVAGTRTGTEGVKVVIASEFFDNLDLVFRRSLS